MEQESVNPAQQLTSPSAPGESIAEFNFRESWWMKRIGMDKVWEKGFFGDPRILTAVLDSGVNRWHPHLTENTWISSQDAELDIFGEKVVCRAGDWGFDAENFSCRPGDEGRHGTGVAGVIAGRRSGLNRVGRVLSVRVLPAATPAGLFGRVEHLTRGIEFVIQLKKVQKKAADVRVVNCSLGFDENVAGEKLEALKQAVARANAAGILIVAAAGNGCGVDIRQKPYYPAALDAENLISVSALDETDRATATSSVGADIGAPGIGIFTTVGRTGGGYLHKTSIAAAFVSGAAALVLSRCPELSPKDLRELILRNADPIDRAAPPPHGRLNVWKSLNECMENMKKANRNQG